MSDTKKFIETFNTDEWEIETESGWKNIKALGKTIPYKIWMLKLENGLCLKCADNHIVIDKDFNNIFVKDLTKEDNLITKKGNSKVKSIIESNDYEEMYDIEIDSESHTYFTNGILSHNSLWLANLAAKSVQGGFNTAYLTFELQEELVHMRIGSNMLNYPLDEYEKLAEDQDLLKNKLNDLRKNSFTPMGNLYVAEFPSSTASVNDIKYHLKKTQELLGYKFENVFVDYINIMKNWRNPNTENTYMKIKQISEDLRAMAMEERWAVITVTQTNRCLHPNSIVIHREKGKIKLSEVSEGDYILGDDGYNRVKNKWVNEKIKTYKIKTKSGKEIIASANHVFPVNNSLQQVSNIKEGDKIYIKRFG